MCLSQEGELRHVNFLKELVYLFLECSAENKVLLRQMQSPVVLQAVAELPRGARAHLD